MARQIVADRWLEVLEELADIQAVEGTREELAVLVGTQTARGVGNKLPQELVGIQVVGLGR